GQAHFPPRLGGESRRGRPPSPGAKPGGVGSRIIGFFSENGYPARVTALGIDDRFVEHGTPQELYRLCGLDEDAVYRALVDEGR
ncbi:MAG: 1-deoxy-D-xylulose-5-phosphate synthase, partial [Alistipes sp.]|nr:1-deoxy-D-xylulose-5-phosphate synthase [Alistipes sp.]